jgi:hypothetical protein
MSLQFVSPCAHLTLPTTNEESLCHVLIALGQEVRVRRDASSLTVIADGVTRRMAWVGFKEPRAAARAHPAWCVVRMVRRVRPSATRTAFRVRLLRAPTGHAPTWRTLGAPQLSVTVP